MTTTATVNSGAINEVGFPGSQEGASLIELVGTVLITGVISTVTVLSTCGATTTASAEGVINKANIRAQLTAAVSPTAETFCGAQTKLQTIPDDATATAEVSSVGAYLSRKLGGTGAATAASTANANVRTFRGATGSCAANAASIDSKRRIQFSAYINPSALTTLEALRRESTSAIGLATVTSYVDAARGRAVSASTTASSVGTTTEVMKFAHFVSATTEPSAFGTADTVRWATASATTTGRATTSVGGRQNATTQLDPLLVGVTTSVDTLINIPLGATIPQSLISVVANVGLISEFGAETSCSATVSCDITLKNNISCVPVTAGATAADIDTLRLTPYGASTVANAITADAYPLRLMHSGASLELAPALSAIPKLIIPIGATTPAVADPGAVGAEVENYVTPDLQPAAALCAPIEIQLRTPVSASTESIASCQASIGMQIGVSATTEARALWLAIGADYAVTIQAPIERRMSVAYSNRRMEVIT